MREDVEQIKGVIVPVLRDHGVTKAALFGSLVRDELQDDSDIDILIEIDESKSLLDIVALKLDLENILNRRVDLVEYDTIREPLKEGIMDEQVLML